jgi:hypothetical protein
MDTGCLRSLQSSYLTQGSEQYTFGQVTGAVIVAGGSNYTAPTVAFSGGGGSGVAATLGVSGGAVNTVSFTSFGSGYSTVPSYVISDATGAGAQLALGIINTYTYDIIGVHVLWGTQRYSLRWYAFSFFSAQLRPWTAATYQQQPIAFSAYGENSIFIGPPPDQSYSVEFDTVVLPTPLADYVTIDPIPTKLQRAVQFYAAYRALQNMRLFGEAEAMRGIYDRTLVELGATSYIRRIADPYSNWSTSR